MVIYPFLYHEHIIGILKGSSEYSQYTDLVAKDFYFEVIRDQRGRAAYTWIQSNHLLLLFSKWKNNVKFLVSSSEQAEFSLSWSQSLQTGFLAM